MNRNQTPVNRDFVLAIHETRFGTRLVDAIMDRPDETARRCGLMRAYSPEFELEQKERKKMDKKMKALAYIADLSKQAANIYRDAETFRALEAIATSHVHVPFQTFDDFVVFCKYSGTAKQVQDQVHDRLRDALYMFRDVHGMDTVPLLVDIFGPPRARRILSSGGVSFSNRNLFHKVQRCGAYLEQRGSPKGFYGWPYLAAAAPRDDAVCMLAGGFGCRRTVLPPSWRPGAGLTIVDHAEENIMSSYPEVEVELVESEPESESEDDMGRDDGNETDPGYYSRSSGDSGLRLFTGQAQSLLLVVHAHDREHRTESLLAHQLHVVGHVRDHRGLEVLAPEIRIARSPHSHPCTALHRVAHVGLDDLQLPVPEDRSDIALTSVALA